MPLSDTNNRALRWLVYRFAWWIVRRELRQNRSKLIAAGVVALVLAGGAAAARAASD
jgi:hypothetical protein